MTSAPPPDDPEGRAPTGFGITFDLRPGAPRVIELEGRELVAEDSPDGSGPLPPRPALRLLHGGLDDGTIADEPAAPVDEPPGR